MHQTTDECLKGKISAGQRVPKIDNCVSRINRRQRFSAVVDLRNHPNTRVNLVANIPKKIFGHKRHIDRQCQQMRCAHPRQRSSKAAERPARRRSVRNKLNGRRPPGRIRSCRNKDFCRLQFPEETELNFPKRSPAEENGRLVFAHPPRFTTREQHTADVHGRNRRTPPRPSRRGEN